MLISHDGSLSGLINISDVRENDILESTYTIEGLNPVNKGNITNTYYFLYTDIVNLIFTSIIADSYNKVHYKEYDGAYKPTLTTLL